MNTPSPERTGVDCGSEGENVTHGGPSDLSAPVPTIVKGGTDYEQALCLAVEDVCNDRKVMETRPRRRSMPVNRQELGDSP